MYGFHFCNLNSRHTLQVLKDINLEQFPMAKYIVGSSAEVGPPKYLKDSLDMMKIGESYISALDGEWPSAEELKLDQTQFTAYHAALTREFAIIQGPPGAGKTFLGKSFVLHWILFFLILKNSNCDFGFQG